MGLFSSSTKTQVFTSVVRAIEDKAVPNSATDSVLKAIIENQSVADTIIEETLNGPALKVERMYRQAERGDYFYGLPNTNLRNRNSGIDTIQAQMAVFANESVTINYAEFASIHPLHLAWQTLSEQYGYNHTTNEIETLTTQIGHPVYLDNILAGYPLNDISEADPGTLDNFTPNPAAGYTPEKPSNVNQYRGNVEYILDPTEPRKAVIKYVWKDVDKVIQRGDFEILMGNYDTDRDYFQVKYTGQTSGIVYYWTYRDGLGTYPEIDAIYEVSYDVAGTYFPFVVFRSDRENRTAEDRRDTEEFKSTEKLLQNISMDFATVGESIHENPDITDVEQAVLMLAVPANNATSQPELRYLYEFFDWLYSQSVIDPLTPNSPNSIRRANNTIVWADADYKMTLNYGNVTRRLQAGKIGPKDHYNTGINSYEETYSVWIFDLDGESTIDKRTRTINEKIFRHQVTESMYEEIRVTNPTMKYDIWRNYSYLGGTDSDQLIIPVDRNIAKNFNLLDREVLYFRSLNYVFNSRITQKVKWYESSFFRFVLIVAAIVITYFTGGFSSPLIAGAISLGLYGLAAAMIVVSIIGFALKAYAFKLIIKELGVEASIILSLTAAALGAGMGLAGANVGYLPSATNLLRLSTGLTTAVNNRNKVLMSEYNGETQSFELLKEKKNEELEKAMALLDGNTIDPFAFIGEEPITVFGESTEDFYQRTIHTGNIGNTVFKSVESYVDISLTLPDMQSTVGDTING